MVEESRDWTETPPPEELMSRLLPEEKLLAAILRQWPPVEGLQLRTPEWFEERRKKEDERSRQIFEEILAPLTRPQRKIYELWSTENLTITEISQRIHRSEGAVEGILLRASRAIRKLPLNL